MHWPKDLNKNINKEQKYFLNVLKWLEDNEYVVKFTKDKDKKENLNNQSGFIKDEQKQEKNNNKQKEKKNSKQNKFSKFKLIIKSIISWIFGFIWTIYLNYSTVFAHEFENNGSNSSGGSEGIDSWIGIILSLGFVILVELIQLNRRIVTEEVDPVPGEEDPVFLNYKMDFSFLGQKVLHLETNEGHSWFFDFIWQYWPIIQHGLSLIGGGLIYYFYQTHYNNYLEQELKRHQKRKEKKLLLKEQKKKRILAKQENKDQEKFKKEEEIKNEGYNKRWERYKDRTENKNQEISDKEYKEILKTNAYTQKAYKDRYNEK